MRRSVRAAFKVYAALWSIAKPLLSCNSRLKEGWGQRTLGDGLPAPADLWIQAASGGEAFLAREVLLGMKSPYPGRPVRVLCTTNTQQGYEVLARTADNIHSGNSGVVMQYRMFPFDAPGTMQQAFDAVKPRVAMLLETEIWPGFLAECHKRGVRVLLANGRMNPRSLAGYLTWPGLFRDIAPDAVMAVSDKDAARFGTLFGHERVATMQNIKFDRMVQTGGTCDSNPLENMLSHETPFVVLGSVRREEEPQIERMLDGLRRRAPKAVIGLFPRHMSRVGRWSEYLDTLGVPWVLRSQVQGRISAGSIVIWDTFGELMPAYGMAKAVFVGGNLHPRLKGQNFLEPLTCGLRPVIGPYWSSFHWVGREIVDSGLVEEVFGPDEAVEALCRRLTAHSERKRVVAEAGRYIRSHTGGSEAVRKRLAQLLINE